jgi:hypothetical protein
LKKKTGAKPLHTIWRSEPKHEERRNSSGSSQNGEEAECLQQYGQERIVKAADCCRRFSIPGRRYGNLRLRGPDALFSAIVPRLFGTVTSGISL